MGDDTLIMSRQDRSKTPPRKHTSKPRGARLVMLSGTHPGRVFPMGSDTTLGRGTAVTIQLIDGGISRQHARIYLNEDERYVLEDSGSRNGIRLNGETVDKQVLGFGDKIQLGTSTVLLFTHHDDLEDQLLQSQRLESVGQLAGGVAHDFNNLLAAILSNVHVLLDTDDLDRDELHECLTEVQSAATRAGKLTHQLLSFARQGKYEERPVQICTLINEATQLARRTFHRSIRIQQSCDSGLFVSGDSTQLHQVFMNLCLNARDAMPEGGTLTISARVVQTRDSEPGFPVLTEDRYVKISVADTGDGIAPEVLTHIFEPFFTTKADGLGTGLGLATAYGIVTNHGGRINVNSEVGQGTEFQVFLPFLEPARRRGEVGTSTILATDPTALSVLVVDDEPLVLRSSIRVLRKLGFSVMSASGGAEAVELYLARGDEIDLVVLDLMMPKMDGAETMSRLLQIDPKARILLTSGYNEDTVVRDLLENGAVGFVPKPYAKNTLAAAINAVAIGTHDS